MTGLRRLLGMATKSILMVRCLCSGHFISAALETPTAALGTSEYAV